MTDENKKEKGAVILDEFKLGKGCYRIVGSLEESEDGIAIFEVVTCEGQEKMVKVADEAEWFAVAETWWDLLEDEEFTIVIIDEDGEEHEFDLLGELEIGGSSYMVLSPLEEGDDEDEEVLILKVVTGENDEEFLVDIEDDLEWEMVLAEWEKVLEE